MARLRTLEKTLSRMFKAPATKKTDIFRKERHEAKRLAALHGFEIEKMGDGGMNVWPPKELADTEADPYLGDHFAGDWAEALDMAQAYASRVTPPRH